MNPHFYRLRKGTVGKDLGVPERATERCERDFLSLVLRVGNSNANRPERPRPYQAMDLQLLKMINRFGSTSDCDRRCRRCANRY